MSKNLARAVELEQTAEENLADDVVFEPSLMHDGKLVGIAIKDGAHVCWNCFARIGPKDHVDKIMGMGALVRLCEKTDCNSRADELNADRAERDRKGLIVRLGDLTEDERVELVDEIRRKKGELRH